MPYLNWIGREAVLGYQHQIPYRLLSVDGGLSFEQACGNMLIEGDNLQALKAILPYFRGRIKCVYIDPPYNTGNEDWIYNDAVNAPEMRAWLEDALKGQAVKADDLSRHDKWLCMMYPRLSLLWELVSEDGSLWMSIDDNEVHNARAILDEIFGGQNFVATVIWEKAYAAKSSAKYLSDRHEYILLYAKNKTLWKRNLLPRTEQQDQLYKNPDNDPRGLWRPNNLAARNYYSKGTYAIQCPGGRVIPGPPKGSYWRISEDRLWEMDREGRIWWGESGNNVPAPKIYLTEVKQGLVPETMWFFKDVGHSQEGKKEIIKILPDAETVFMTPKPVRLLQRILQIATSPGDLVLDSFAGSGSTGHAVLQTNAEDGGDRRFILVEMESHIAQNVTARRLNRAINGYIWRDQKGNERFEPGLGGGFNYCQLGEPLFDELGRIREDVSFGDLAYHVFFTETGEPLVHPLTDRSPLIGVQKGTGYYLLWNGVSEYSTLDPESLRLLPPHDGPKVVYAESCRLKPAVLEREGIVFKQIPYRIKVR